MKIRYDQPSRLFVRIPLLAALGYACISAVWIFFSDRLLVSVAGSYTRYQVLQTYKGTFFIFLSALMIYLFLRFAWRGTFSAYSAALESEHRLELALASADGGIWEMNLVDHEERMAFVSPEFAARFGLAPGQSLSAAELGELTHPDDLEGARRAFGQFLSAGTSDTFDICYRLRAQDGNYHWLHSRGSLVRRVDRRAERMVGVSLDVTPQYEAEERLRQLLRYDPATGLVKQGRFIADVDLLLSRAREKNEISAVIKVKISDLEHLIGDNETAEDAPIVQLIGDRLRGFAERNVVAARLAQNIFAFATPPLSSSRAVHALVRDVLAALAEPAECEGGRPLRFQAGGALFPTDGCATHKLLRNGGRALEKAGRTIDSSIVWFTEGLDTEFRLRTERLRDLAHAAADNQISCHFQPLVDLSTGRTSGFEALARWHRDSEGLVPPNDFIPLAEESGFITEIGEEVLRQACLNAVAWTAKSGSAPFVAVNVSPVQLADPAFPATVGRILAETGLSPKRLELEITENAFVHDPDQAAERLNTLRKLGMSIAIDDFGTGYSSLALLTRLPFTRLKIDRSFIASYGRQRENTVIVDTIIDLCRHLDLSVTVEGVEEPAQAEILTRKGVKFAQGYLFSRPVAAREAAALIDRQWCVADHDAQRPLRRIAAGGGRSAS